jgi:hypothetical protein
MNTPGTLPTAPFEHPALDYTFLRQEGIRQLERMAGGRWTDFNTHDPGITILEQLCYALTDLAHRIEFPLPDLLAAPGENAYASLYGPAEILTAHPVTLEDLRKLVIDVEGVKNAWVEKVTDQPAPLYYHAGRNTLSLQPDTLALETPPAVGDPAPAAVPAPQEVPLGVEPLHLQGLYRVLFELSDSLYLDGNEAARAAVKPAVIRRLHQNRAVGEDFVEVVRLQPEEIAVHARIEIEAVEDATALLVEIYRQIADYISPPVRFYSLRQLLAAGKGVDELYEGPRLEHGFIDSDELRQAQRRSALRTSDLIQAIMAVPGVRAVRTISLAKGENQEAWLLTLDPARAPRFNPDLSTIRLERKGLAVTVPRGRARDLFAQGLRHTAAAHKRAQEESDLQPPPGRPRNVGTYYSIQHHLPAAYGVGALGLPESAPPQRKAQARQLKAYLLFFDQLLANYFAQLAHARDLFSFAGVTAQTYFSQPITDPELGLDEIRRSPLPVHAERLQQITEQPEPQAGVTAAESGYRRRSRWLNHLLARFAEQFTDYSLLLSGVTPADGASALEKLVQDQQAFLQEYVQLSSARGTAFNYLEPWSNANRSGLEQRVQRKLGLVATAGETFVLVEHILLRPLEGDAGQGVPFLENPRQPDPFSLQVSFVFPTGSGRLADAGFREFVERTVREETPTHLTPYVHWLDEEAMPAFERAYQAWLEQLRSYWTDRLDL